MTWAGCEVLIASTGEEALALFRKESPNLVVLDIVMPPPDGFQVCREIRKTSQVPILMLTARHATVDKIRALDLGADDYLTKPFDHLELLARLRALVRRSTLSNGLATDATRASGLSFSATEAGETAPSLAAQDLIVGDLRLDTASRRAYLHDEALPLTSTEYRLLEELARNAGTVIPHSVLIERVWGAEYAGEEHYVKVFVRRLRQKMHDDAEDPRYIQSEWGVGYRYVPARAGVK